MAVVLEYMLPVTVFGILGSTLSRPPRDSDGKKDEPAWFS